ncbi:MAG: hypothetical protein ACR2QF_17085 [Geminicoccaceae bacterium]
MTIVQHFRGELLDAWVSASLHSYGSYKIMSEQVINFFKGSDYSRALANVIASITFAVFLLALSPEVVSHFLSKIDLAGFKEVANWVTISAFLLGSSVLLGTILRVSSYIVETALGTISEKFTFRYYYDGVKDLIEKRYQETFDDFELIKSQRVISIIDMVNMLKSFYKDYDLEQDKIVRRHFVTLEITRNIIAFCFVLFFYKAYQTLFMGHTLGSDIALLVVLVVLFFLFVSQFPRRMKKIVRSECVLINSAIRKYQDASRRMSEVNPGPANIPSTASTAH